MCFIKRFLNLFHCKLSRFRPGRFRAPVFPLLLNVTLQVVEHPFSIDAPVTTFVEVVDEVNGWGFLEGNV